jgi:hypothetical protein
MSRISFGMMEAGYIPGDLGAFKKEAGKIKLYGDSAPAQPTDVTQRSLTFPEQLQPYAEKVLGKGQELMDKPYATYDYERISQFDPMQLAAQQAAANLGPSKQLGTATQMAGLAGLNAGDLRYDPTKFDGSYSPTAFTNQFTAPAQYANTTFAADKLSGFGGGTQAASTQSFTDTGTAAKYMNPYTQNVTDIQTREADRLAGIEATKRGAQAVGAGAFGGSRQAIMDAEAARNLATQKGDITAKGQQDAYQQAMAQFNAEQGYGLTAQQANLQANLQSQLANQQQGLTAQQLSEQSKQFGYGQQMTAAQQQAQYGLAAQQAGEQAKQFGANLGMTAQQAAEQSKQYGANLGLQGIQAQLSAAGTLGQLGQTQFGQEKDIINAQAAAGAQRQGLDQAKKDMDYADFQRQQQYDYNNLAFMSDLLRGAPMGNLSQSIYEAPPSTTAQLLGLGTTAAGASRYFAKGGLTALALHNMTK